MHQAAASPAPTSRDCCAHWGIEVRESDYGRGVFASQDLAAGQLLARCPAIIIPRDDMHSATLGSYVFLWPDEAGAFYAILGGVGSFFNHHADANAIFHPDIEQGLMEFHSCRAIAKGEELRINYDYDAEYAHNNPHLAWYRQA